MSINTDKPVKSITYKGVPLTLVGNSGEDNSWMEEPVLTITIEEECSSIYIDAIDGQPFEFEEMAGSYVVQGVTGTADGRLCFAPYKITASYFGFLLTAGNSASGKDEKGVFYIKHNNVGGWYIESNSNQDNSWVSGGTNVFRHITYNQPDSKGCRPFTGVESITNFTLIPYSGNLHPGTVINIYGKPVKKEVEV